MSLVIPSRYQSTGKKFSGGMSRVHVYTDTLLDRQVVIKVLKGTEDIRRARDEIVALQSIRSKYVVEIYDVVVGANAREIGIVEEFVQGADLADILSESKIAAKKFIKILYQIASGLADIHAVEVIHRDVTPWNIRQDQYEFLKLIDFGLARSTVTGSETTGFRGTPGFSAPELYEMGRVYFDKSIDIFAFGALAWYISEGKLPKWIAARSTKRAHVFESFQSAKIKTPPGIAALIDSSLSTERTERPSAHDIREALSSELLEGRHRGRIASGGQIVELTDGHRRARVSGPDLGEVTISYDGKRFTTQSVSGAVYINNEQCGSDQVIDGCCLITLGDPSQGNRRVFATFDVSHPEVML